MCSIQYFKHFLLLYGRIFNKISINSITQIYSISQNYLNTQQYYSIASWYAYFFLFVYLFAYIFLPFFLRLALSGIMFLTILLAIYGNFYCLLTQAQYVSFVLRYFNEYLYIYIYIYIYIYSLLFIIQEAEVMTSFYQVTAME